MYIAVFIFNGLGGATFAGACSQQAHAQRPTCCSLPVPNHADFLKLGSSAEQVPVRLLLADVNLVSYEYTPQEIHTCHRRYTHSCKIKMNIAAHTAAPAEPAATKRSVLVQIES